jgi:iron complex outermembrane recepter protein
VRGRDTKRIFGGGDTVNFGASKIGVYQPIAEPAFNLGVREEDAVRQITPGVTYVGEWKGVGEFSGGLQKAFYDRNFGKLGLPPVATSSKPWLYNGTVALHPTNSLAVYAGYTRGLEEFGTAPDNAANAGQPMRAGITQQVDAGIHYRIIPGLNLVAGVFEVSKPYFDRNTVNIYGEVGSLRHRGFETSLAGKPMENVTVVAGAVFLQARVSGLPVDQGLIGDVPPGTPPSLVRINVQYDIPALSGFSVDGQVEAIGSHYANRLNTLRVPAATTLALGTRYAFTAFGAKATLRGQVLNITNAYDWSVNGASGRLSPSSPRTFSLKLAADF